MDPISCRPFVGPSFSRNQHQRPTVSAKQLAYLDEVADAHKSWHGIIRRINKVRKAEESKRKGWVG